jgi:PucR family transcriptional regulator, purine catabolism regulatory protein
MLPTLRDLSLSLGDDLAPVVPAVAPAVEVSAVHVSELADPTAYLDGGELLLTTGLGFQPSALWFGSYVQRLVGIGVAGLAVGLGPVHDRVPGELAAAAERAGLPLLVVPAATPFLTVTRRYWSVIAESGQRELAEMLSTHRALVAAALGDAPVPAVLRRMAIAIDGWAAHLSPDGRLSSVWPASRRGPALELQSAVRRLHAVGAPTSLSLPLGDEDVVVQPIGGQRLLGYLAVGHPRPLPPRAQQVMMTAVALLTLESAHAGRLRAAARKAEAIALSLLRSGHSGAARAAAEFLGVELPERVRVAVLDGDAGELAEALDALPCRDDHVILAGLVGGVCLVLLRETDGHAGWMADLVSVVRGTRGVVSPACDLERVQHSLGAAMMALAECVPGELADLGLGWSPFDTPRSRSWATQRLAPLDGSGSGELADTLAAYLRGRSEQEAARELGVHRHTVRNRLSRVETLLGVRLDDPDTRAQLWLALRLTGRR